MKISIIGTGYVGLITGVCFADLGHDVECVDVVKEKVDSINQGNAPIHEENLDELLGKHVGKGLNATTDLKAAVLDSDITFVCVGTPDKGGMIDLEYVESASSEIGRALEIKDSFHVAVVKSTVSPRTTDSVVIPILEEFSKKSAGGDFGVCVNPEFLREGKAVWDFMNPDRIIIGEYDKRSGDILNNLYSEFNCPVIRTDLRTAEMIKYASNAFLATKISFINEIANICEKMGVDVRDVAGGIGLDKRINKHFLNAGIGFGGSCFPKDMSALISEAIKENYNPGLLKAVQDINEKQKIKPVEIMGGIIDLKELKNKKIGVLGLAFKGGTDDVRESPAVSTTKELIRLGAKVRVYDPAAMENAKLILGNRVEYCKSTGEALKDAEVCVIATEWSEFGDIYDDITENMEKPVVIDGRRILDPEKAKKKSLCRTDYNF